MFGRPPTSSPKVAKGFRVTLDLAARPTDTELAAGQLEKIGSRSVDTTWQAVVITLIVQAAAVALAYVQRNQKRTPTE